MATDRTALNKACLAAHRAGKLGEAQKLYAQYLGQWPEDAQMWSNFGALLRKTRNFHNAERAHRRAYALDPQSATVRANFANILSDLGKYEESLALRRTLISENPDVAEQHALIGRCLRGLGRYQEAVDYLRPMIDRFPDYPDLSMQAAMSLLALGQYQEAFEQYQARWKTGELKVHDIPLPRWQGEPLEGKRVLVLPEQGFGDCVLMLRHLPDLKALGPQVTLVVEKPLLRLLQTVQGADEVVAQAKPEGFDYFIHVMDLARIALHSDADIRQPTRLTIPQDSKQRAKDVVDPFRKKLKVGVVWTGSVTYKGNAFRSFSHTDFLSLTDINGLQLFSLYKGPMLDAFFADGSAGLIVDAASTDRDFADCAGMMEEMDLVITSDTATAHIAGSMGIPTWVVLHTDAFWVYRHEGEKTPWYPAMRLFRQKQALRWDDVMAEVKSALIERVGGHE